MSHETQEPELPSDREVAKSQDPQLDDETLDQVVGGRRPTGPTQALTDGPVYKCCW